MMRFQGKLEACPGIWCRASLQICQQETIDSFVMRRASVLAVESNEYIGERPRGTATGTVMSHTFICPNEFAVGTDETLSFENSINPSRNVIFIFFFPIRLFYRTATDNQHFLRLTEN